jgi:hypothetical protein
MGEEQSNIVNLDELSAQELLAMLQQAAMGCFPRDRDQFVAACPLSPGNLVGSYFRAPDPNDPNAEALWLEGEPCAVIEGLVVGQPHATPVTSFYLVEFFGAAGAQGYQQVVDLDRMLEQHWSFFDSEDWLAAHSRPEGQAPSSARQAIKQEHEKEPKR